MRLAEGIARKREEHLPDRLHHPATDASLPASVDETLVIVGKLFRTLLADHFAQTVRFSPGESRQGHGHPHHVFLVHQNPVSLRQELFEPGMERLIGGSVQAPEVFLNEAVGGRSDDGRVDHEMPKIAAPRSLL